MIVEPGCSLLGPGFSNNGVKVNNLLATGITLPDTGVDLALFVAAAIIAMGLLVLTIVGGFFSFLIIKRGMRWAGKAFG